jgi:hypothetical protein
MTSSHKLSNCTWSEQSTNNFTGKIQFGSQAKKQNMTQKTVAGILVETLIAAGVKRIYGVVGDSLNGILEEIRRSKKVFSAREPSW